MFCLQIVDFQHNLDCYVEQAATALKLFSQSQSDVHYSQTDIHGFNELTRSSHRPIESRERKREREKKKEKRKIHVYKREKERKDKLEWKREREREREQQDRE